MPSIPVEQCSGFVPSLFRSKRCKICGHSLKSHTAASGSDPSSPDNSSRKLRKESSKGKKEKGSKTTLLASEGKSNVDSTGSETTKDYSATSRSGDSAASPLAGRIGDVTSSSSPPNERSLPPQGSSHALHLESKQQVGDYVLLERLGKGAYGVVYKAINISLGNTVAIKQLNLRGVPKEVVQSLEAEINLLRSLDHENIVRYIGHERTAREFNIIMEFVENGSLGSMVKRYGRFPEPLVKTYVKKTLVGLVYLHDQGVIHRDIKPDNILITKDGQVKLADFGVSTTLDSLKNNRDHDAPAGTPYYMAPEIIEFQGAKPASDIWSLGCAVLELLRGQPPYFHCDPFAAMYHMVEDTHPPLPTHMSEALNDFLLACFKKNVNQRVSALQLTQHPWLRAVDKPQANISEVTAQIGEYNEGLKKEDESLSRTMMRTMNQEQSELLARNHSRVLKTRSSRRLLGGKPPNSSGGGRSAASPSLAASTVHPTATLGASDFGSIGMGIGSTINLLAGLGGATLKSTNGGGTSTRATPQRKATARPLSLSPSHSLRTMLRENSDEPRTPDLALLQQQQQQQQRAAMAAMAASGASSSLRLPADEKASLSEALSRLAGLQSEQSAAAAAASATPSQGHSLSASDELKQDRSTGSTDFRAELSVGSLDFRGDYGAALSALRSSTDGVVPPSEPSTPARAAAEKPEDSELRQSGNNVISPDDVQLALENLARSEELQRRPRPHDQPISRQESAASLTDGEAVFEINSTLLSSSANSMSRSTTLSLALSDQQHLPDTLHQLHLHLRHSGSGGGAEAPAAEQQRLPAIAVESAPISVPQSKASPATTMVRETSLKTFAEDLLDEDYRRACGLLLGERPRAMSTFEPEDGPDISDEADDIDFGTSPTASSGFPSLRPADQQRLLRRPQNESNDWGDDVPSFFEDAVTGEADLETPGDGILYEMRELIQTLKQGSESDKVVNACLRLTDMVTRHEELQSQLVASSCLLSLIALLGHDSSAVVNSVLRLISRIIEEPAVHVSLCVLGIMSAIADLGPHAGQLLTRLYIGHFLQRTAESAETFQMFVASGGVGMLVDLLAEPFDGGGRDLVVIAIDTIGAVLRNFRRQGVPRRNEYFHLFIRCDFMPHLTTVLLSFYKEKKQLIDSSNWTDSSDQSVFMVDSYIMECCMLLHKFALGDSEVRRAMCVSEVLKDLVDIMELLDPLSRDSFLLFRTLQSLSMESESLKELAIIIQPTLRVALSLVEQGTFVKEVFVPVTTILSHLCRLSRNRQETASKNGLMRFLKFVIVQDVGLKEFIVPLLCDLADSAPVVRSILLDSNGLDLYLDLLADSAMASCSHEILAAIASCMENERARSEPVLLVPERVFLITSVISTAPDHVMLRVFDSLHKILGSPEVNRTFGSWQGKDGLAGVLGTKLSLPDAHARLGVLRVLTALCTGSGDAFRFLSANGLVAPIKALASDDTSMLVRSMAVQLLKEAGVVLSG